MCTHPPRVRAKREQPNLCILLHLVTYDSAEVILEHLLLSWYPPPSLREVSKMFTFKPRPKPGRVCLICAAFARQRNPKPRANSLDSVTRNPKLESGNRDPKRIRSTAETDILNPKRNNRKGSSSARCAASRPPTPAASPECVRPLPLYLFLVFQ